MGNGLGLRIFFIFGSGILSIIKLSGDIGSGRFSGRFSYGLCFHIQHNHYSKRRLGLLSSWALILGCIVWAFFTGPVIWAGDGFSVIFVWFLPFSD